MSKSAYGVSSLEKKAKDLGYDLEIVDIKDINNLSEQIKSFGDIVMWRSASVTPKFPYARTIALKLLKNKNVINSILHEQPYIRNKMYQQTLAQRAGIPTIKTWQHSSLDELKKNKELKYPFVAKPRLGKKGDGIIKVETESDLNKLLIPISKYVFQNYIENDGDFRVLMIKDEVIGIIKRTAKEGEWLNNVSMGASAEMVENEDVNKLAKQIHELFPYDYCGVDIIYDKSTNQYKFLEINAAPGWQGFEQTTGIDVAEKLLNSIYGK